MVLPKALSMTTLSLHAASHIAETLYALRGEVVALTGEYDANFCITTPTGERFVLKIARPAEELALLEFQNALLARLAASEPDLPIQAVLPTTTGALIGTISDATGAQRFVRLLRYVQGRLLVETRPHTPALLESLGAVLARIDRALVGFEHPAMRRDLHWDLAHSGWIRAGLAAIDDAARQALVLRQLEHFEREVRPRLAELPHSVIHNDANDYNVLVAGSGAAARVTAIIDVGDSVYTATICDLAICLAYAILDKPDPLAAAAHVLRGYHAIRPLSDAELQLLYPLILTRLAASVTNAAQRKQQQPTDPYIVVSEQPAWRTLDRLEAIHPRLAYYALRAACGYEPVPQNPRLVQWLTQHQATFAPVVAADLTKARVFDLSASSVELGNVPDFSHEPTFAQRLEHMIAAVHASAGIGRYDEPRLIYTADTFRQMSNEGPVWRTLHIALDIFLPTDAPVFAPLDGVIHSLRDNAGDLDYGPTVIIRHTVANDLTFYTLYGHLAHESLAFTHVGETVHKGQPIGAIGSAAVNGGWPPHLHFQLINDMLDRDGEFPGVARPDERALWLSLSPDANLITRIPATCFPPPNPSKAETLAARRRLLGGNLSIAYHDPLKIVRGWKQYLYDEMGRRYLDVYNNVPHVGHSHPKVVAAGQAQMAILNTNTRYLSDTILRYAERLTALLPDPLRVCYFVNSASEANELALRLARAYTQQRDMIVLDAAYHGHTTTLVDISPYKAMGPGGAGVPAWVHVAPIPDDYRGPYKRTDPAAGPKYAHHVAQIITELQANGGGLAAYIAESLPSVGGQIVPPSGYLRAVYAAVRGAGGLCIADEVQVGFGRLGSHFWGFELQAVVPDIIVLGKPMGNGHPMGAVVTTAAIADAFDNGMEFFSTFGGNNVSAAIGLAVLDVLEAEQLQRHALEVGTYLLKGLRDLGERCPIVGDARGAGLFLGLELVRSRETREPADSEAAYVVNRLRERGILAGTDGPFHNVIKIRPPMPFTFADADMLVECLGEVLDEANLRGSPRPIPPPNA